MSTDFGAPGAPPALPASPPRPALPMEPAGLSPELVPIFWALDRERRAPARRDPAYLVRVQRDGMTRMWRRKICRWMFQTTREFDLQTDSAGSAMHFLDEFLSGVSVARSGLQLMGMVCLWSATKLNEARPILMAEMDIMCERKFSRAEMTDAEQRLANAIGFRFCPPNCFTFARSFVALLPWESEREHNACVAAIFDLLELVVEEAASIGCTLSSLALAAVQLIAPAKFGVSRDDVSREVLLQGAAYLVRTRALNKATALVSDVYYRQEAEADQATEAFVTSSPTSVHETLGCHAVPSDPKRDHPDCEVNLFADETETLDSDSDSDLESDSESTSSRERGTRSWDDEDVGAGSSKRRRTS